MDQNEGRHRIIGSDSQFSSFRVFYELNGQSTFLTRESLIMPVNPNLKRLVDLAAPYWAGEAEVVWTYFQSPRRTKDSDLLWLRRQCFKEIWGSGVGDKNKGLFQGPVAYLSDVFPKIDSRVDRHEVLDVIDDLRTEFFHYCLFADIYDSLSGEKLNPEQLTGWESDNELARMRYEYREQRGKLGYFAVRFTEGGYCSMYPLGCDWRWKRGE